MSTKNKKTTKPNCFRHLDYKDHYKSFDDFYGLKKEQIYLAIVDLFAAFSNTKKNILSLKITANISDMVWDTEFKFSKKEFFVLKRDIMPHFEENENYEVCSRIISLDKELSS